jgi:hypothetical protein
LQVKASGCFGTRPVVGASRSLRAKKRLFREAKNVGLSIRDTPNGLALPRTGKIAPNRLLAIISGDYFLA